MKRLRETLRSMNPDEVVYIGCQGASREKYKANGSGFIFIGTVNTALHDIDSYMWRKVLDQYPRTVVDPGTIILIEGAEHGKYWFWYEYDQRVPAPDKELTMNTEHLESLLAAIARQCASDYRSDIMQGIKNAGNRKDENTIEEIISFCRANTDIEFLQGTNTGEYILQTIDDECRILWAHPEMKKMDYDDQKKFIAQEKKKLMEKRVRKQARSRYATIKGRSVYHE